MDQPKRKIIATSALIYANGPLHIGHLVEYIQTDIWVRFQRMRGHDCYYICGSDAHGTPIMLAAEQKGLKPEALIQQIADEHQQDFAKFAISFDSFHSTHSEENRQLVTDFYQKLQAAGDIEKHIISQAYDPDKNMFLPDRYVKGECPRCGAAEQYGDSCEKCGAIYSPTELKNPKSVVSGATPIAKESEHYFFKLANYEKRLKAWGEQGALQPQVQHKLQEWFDAGLQDWNISRDAPYFGFQIPESDNKYFYVWLDAPIGYIHSFKKFCEQHPEIDFDSFWQAESNTELYHFIGKDIGYFHTLFWPAVLASAGKRLPTAVYTHGFLTINGKKMSKSRGTFIKASSYLEHLNPNYLRYYYAAKLSAGVDDIDFNFEDFRLRVNADLVGKVINIASRSASFINKKFANQLAGEMSEQALYEEFIQAGDDIANAYEEREYSRAIRLIMALADKANQYVDTHKPWALAKIAGNEQQVQAVCSTALNLFKVLMTYLKPVVPELAARVETFLNIPAMTWDNRSQLLLDHEISKFKPLLNRIDEAQLVALAEAEKSLINQ